jgi:hypothetical protein
VIKEPVEVRHGMMLLTPGSLKVLGGQFDDVDQRLAKIKIAEDRLK